MKRLVSFVIISLLLLCSCSKTKYLQKRATKAHIEFKTGVHDFGKVIFGEPASFDFIFTNTGTDTLQINEVQSTCGCTIPQWSKTPVAPGDKGVITVSYDTRRSGEFEKGITVFSNADNSALLLVIKGFVTPNPHKEILGRNKVNTNIDSMPEESMEE